MDKRRTKDLASSLARKNIRIVSIAPGGKHCRVTVTDGSRVGVIFTSVSPSCSHAYSNATRDAVKVLARAAG